ncbi:hypothetical protein GKN94_09345 [Candidatus Lucifugimonas marina]|uniref:hypothetical protein n=1 Tax=Candidatus Lucifugimonas marina TaxID=3038979 RepID=UPI0027A9F132|nr:hypothetical protein [SAR202 cluster bacterium JH639]WFG35887.1 hypothetical protein GKN94_09345 [SAR202 cluster bacterium JH545]
MTMVHAEANEFVTQCNATIDPVMLNLIQYLVRLTRRRPRETTAILAESSNFVGSTEILNLVQDDND